MDESNATCGKRLASIGLENTEANRQAYRTLLVSAPGLGQYISGAILFEETLYQNTVDGEKIVDVLVKQNIVPGIKVDKVIQRKMCMILRTVQANYHFLCFGWEISDFFCLIRDWFLLLAPTMSRGAKDSTVLLPAPLHITSRALALLNGEILYK